MKEIQLTQGQVALVDDEDFEELNKYNWSADKGKYTFYAVRATFKAGKYKRYRMQNVISGVLRTDHKDGNGLNNQRYNLRPASRAQNNMNTAKAKTSNGKPTSSPYKGVCFHKATQLCTAQIMVNGKRIHLGTFGSDHIAAAKAYDVAAVHYFGEFARINFPVDKTPAVV